MATQAQMNANRQNAQKSTGPKTAEGKAVVAQNAIKHGLFAQENVIKCEKVSDFNRFREELMAGLAPVGGVEALLAERIVSLSWRLKRVERMNSEVIDAMIAIIKTDSWHKELRADAGLLDSETGRSELVLGWVTNQDFSDSQVLERLLVYEKRIESSLYKAMNELQKLQHMRKREQAETEQAIPIPINDDRDEAATHRGRDAHETQGRDALATEAATRSQGRDALATEAAIHSEDQAGQIEKQTQITGLRPEIRSTKCEILNKHAGTNEILQNKAKAGLRPEAPSSKSSTCPFKFVQGKL